MIALCFFAFCILAIYFFLSSAQFQAHEDYRLSTNPLANSLFCRLILFADFMVLLSQKACQRRHNPV